MKRAFDLLGAMGLLLVLAPVIAVTALLVRANLGSPVIFAQERLGRDAAIFRLYKFRSMTDERDAGGQLKPDAQRLTRFGRFLRAWSLDELPQLFNVIKGDMSLVGPRPLLPQYRDRYSPRQFTRHAVRPGITGLAQVRGRNSLDWEDRLELDAVYVETRSFWLDMKILLTTLAVMVSRKGISAQGHATMEEFKGRDDRTGGTR